MLSPSLPNCALKPLHTRARTLPPLTASHPPVSSVNRQQHSLHRAAPLGPHSTLRAPTRTSTTTLATQQDAQAAPPKNAREAVEQGLQAFKERRDYNGAVQLYKQAMASNPNEDEARAAMYNMGCAYAKLKQWQPATDCVLSAINDYNLKLSVALKDEDLRELQDRREWADALTVAKGGLSRNSKIDLRTEAKTPFRFPRIVILGGLGLGAAAGLVIILLRLVASLIGGPNAPDLQETLQNLAINTTATGLIGFILYRDVTGKQKSDQVTEREEYLSRLLVDLGNNRILPLLRFRGQVRPVIVCGPRRYVESVLRAASPYQMGLRERGVSVVPVILDEVERARRIGVGTGEIDPAEKIRRLKAELRGEKVDTSKGFGNETKAQKEDREQQEQVERTGVLEEDRKWRLTPFYVIEWKDWVEDQRKFANLPEKAVENGMYVQVQLDGTVRSSGLGIPPWGKFMDDLPTLSSIRTTFTDGIGPSI